MLHEWGDESGVLPRSSESHKSRKAELEKSAHVIKPGVRKDCGRNAEEGAEGN